MMKAGNIFFSVFIFAILILGCFEVLNVYSPSASFESEVSEHMKSSFLIKESFLDDYFLENKLNALVLSSSKEVNEIFMSGNILSYEKDYLERFSNLSDYSNLYLINLNGKVIYEYVDEGNLGQDVTTSTGFVLPLVQIIEASKNEEVFSFGPYKKLGEEILYISFISSKRSGGIVILEKTMSEINNIVAMNSRLGESEEFYLLNEENYLVTPIGAKYNPLTQTMTSKGIFECFLEKNLVSPTFIENYAGEVVYGAYEGISEFDWCLSGEVLRKELIEDPIKRNLFSNLIFIFASLIVLAFILLLFKGSLNKKYSLKIMNKKRGAKKLVLFVSLIFAGLAFGAISFVKTLASFAMELEIALPVIGNIIFSLVVFIFVYIFLRRRVR